MPGRKGIEHRPERQPMRSGAVNEHNARPIATHVICEGGPIDRNGAHAADTTTSPSLGRQMLKARAFPAFAGPSRGYDPGVR